MNVPEIFTLAFTLACAGGSLIGLLLAGGGAVWAWLARQGFDVQFGLPGEERHERK